MAIAEAASIRLADRLTALARTTSVRLSALYLVLFVVCAVVLLFYVMSMAERFLQSQTQQTIEQEVAALGEAYRYGGMRLLVRVVERRSRQPGANLYVIASPAGNILSGNVQALQPGILDNEGWTRRPFHFETYTETESDKKRLALAQVIALPNGMRLLVGRDLGDPVLVRGLIRRALVVALSVMGVGALLIWVFVGRGALRRIDRMSVATGKIMAGDLSQRLPIVGSDDEFDRLSVSLNAMLGRIERLNEGLRQVSDNIAHDLKTPLTRLRNRAEAALAVTTRDDAEAALAYRGALEKMIAEADQLIGTFNALLMISRVEAGSAAAAMSAVDLSAIVSDTLELYEPVAEEAGLDLTGGIARDVMVRGNRELIAQALSNLIENALKYGGGPGHGQIRVHLVEKDGKVVLSVTDQGVGIPADQRCEVIKRFVRLDDSRSKPGTGLGLSLVQAVMELHHGQLQLADGEPGLADGRPGLCAMMIFPSFAGEAER